LVFHITLQVQEQYCLTGRIDVNGIEKIQEQTFTLLLYCTFPIFKRFHLNRRKKFITFEEFLVKVEWALNLSFLQR